MTEEITIATHDEEESFTKKARSNPWMVSTIVLGVVALILIIGSFSGFGMTGNAISEDVAGQIIVDFAKQQTGQEMEVVEINEESGLYEVIVLYQGEEVPLYLTKDGKSLVNGLTPLVSFDEQPEEKEEVIEVTKSDKPEVELFVMTHCPYGTQAEKGFIPVMKAFENVADLKIRFVHYFMHDPEEAETPLQVCIREEQSDKYLDYLECFLGEGNSEDCLVKAGIDRTALNTCIETNSEGYYSEDSELSEGYGVQGSPTLVVNGQIVSSGRNPSAYAQVVCSAFNTAPGACSDDFSTANPSPGFGYGEGSATSAQC